MRRLAFLSVFMSVAGAAWAQDFDNAVLRGSNGFEPPLTAAPVDAADGPSYPIDAATPVAPAAAAPGLPALREFHVEVGGRYWYSTGSFTKTLNDDPRFSNNLDSRLTYSNLVGQSFEAFGRVDHLSGFFVKGFVGLGSIDAGSLTDEDFPPAVVPYSNTTSNQRSGHLTYFTADFGYNFVQGPGYRVGAFGGYNYIGETLNAYGCMQNTNNQEICVPLIPTSVLGITENAGWNSMRVGVGADVLLFGRLRLSADAAWVPFTRMVSTDTHWLREDIITPIPEQGSGNGLQLEAFAAFQATECWSLGVGARYWRLNASGIINVEAAENVLNAVAEPGGFTTDRYGVFAQAAYKFGMD
jgi:hypothetical protein